MAEVLTPLPRPSSAVTMLHQRPSSADTFQTNSSQYHSPTRHSQTPRAMYTGGPSNYRGTSTAPVQPYAFQATPNLRNENRTSSAPSSSHGPIGGHRGHVPSASTSSASDTSSVPSAKDDSVMGSRPGSTINLSVTQLPELTFTPFETPIKASPDRYRRPGQKRTDSNTSTARAANASPEPANSDSLSKAPLDGPRLANDDMAIRTPVQESAKRYRRRSLNTLDTSSYSAQAIANSQRPASAHGATSTPTTIRPISFHSNTGSDDGDRSASSVSLQRVESGSSEAGKASAVKDAMKPAVVPPRDASMANRRVTGPSPLSKQANDDGPTVEAAVVKTRTYAAAAQSAVASPSPAAQQLAAVSDKDLNKGMKSRLRRAFSFGSAQELRRAAMEGPSTTQQLRDQHHQRVEDELDAESMEVARRQEAAGIGAGIYSGQGGFTGSTDNLSISSTASSASMMLRKMGRGAKKSAKSIKGLFRPKSVIGVPAADGPVAQSSPTVQPSVGQVSMVTVEAERHKVNINAEASEKFAGGTGFPKLERNSIDAANATNSLEVLGSADGSDARRSIVGSDKDRAEVLAAVKKGILKRSGTASPNGSPIIKALDAGHTPVPQLNESPAPSMPSTPRDGQQGRGLAANGDYFSQRLTKSVANTPNGSVRTISFSPRIQFHDAWSSSDYDRRGDIATCNRLTPLLAQQIKEELNTFKMEMEVHEMSKPHTHFF